MIHSRMKMTYFKFPDTRKKTINYIIYIKDMSLSRCSNTAALVIRLECGVTHCFA